MKAAKENHLAMPERFMFCCGCPVWSSHLVVKNFIPISFKDEAEIDLKMFTDLQDFHWQTLG
jgi:hypothetical protein